MQQWFNLSDPQTEDALYDIEPMRRFAGIELAEDAIPDETTILHFRHLLEKHKLTEKIFAEVRTLLEEKRLLLKSGTIVDATIISAPSSTKNESNSRDPEMQQAKKHGQWYFGMKVHIGASKQGLVHSLATNCCTVKSASSMAIRRIGAGITGCTVSAPASTTESIGARRQDGPSPTTRKQSIAVARPAAPAASLLSAW
jgi:IS5 family transposase